MLTFQHIFVLLLAFNISFIPFKSNKKLSLKSSVSISTLPVNKKEFVKIKYGKYLGNEKNNYYGEKFNSNFNLIWKFYLGSGETLISKFKGKELLFGSGWTGQPLLIKENNTDYLVIGAYDHKLKKINAKIAELIWEYEFDDIIKSTGCVYINKTTNSRKYKYLILQGSRIGLNVLFNDSVAPSYRAVSYITGEEIWKLNIRKTESYSRDVDGTALIINDTAYIGLENGIFTVFNPNHKFATIKNEIKQPYIIQELKLFNENDVKKHNRNIVTESTPCKLKNHIYITSGSGHVYGYNLNEKKIDYDFYVGADLNGSPVVTSDSCILVSVEKQYIPGKGGLLKIDPEKSPEECVEWFFPTGNRHFADWDGGIIGSPAVSDLYYPEKKLAAVLAIDGFLYVIRYDAVDSSQTVAGPQKKNKYYKPVMVFKYNVGPSISTPLFLGNCIVAASYQGLYLFEFDDDMSFNLKDFRKGVFESTPLSYNNRIYIASRDGYLYCLGDTSSNHEMKTKKIEIVEKKAENKKNKTVIKPDFKLSLISFIRKYNKNIDKKNNPKDDIISALIDKTGRSEKGDFYYVIAGSFTIKTNADNFVNTLKNIGYNSEIVCYINGFYYVSIYKTNTKTDALNKMNSFKMNGYKDAWVYKK